MLALNLNRTEAQPLILPAVAIRYTLTANDLMSHTVLLNGRELKPEANGDVSIPAGTPTAAGKVTLPAASITFFTIPTANYPACK